MKQRLSIKQRQYGVNLVEIMIALTLGLFLMLGASTMFFTNKRIYRETEQMARMQDSARAAIDMLTQDIRMAGFVGCHFNPSNIKNQINQFQSGELYDHRFFIEGRDGGNWRPSGVNLPIVTTGVIFNGQNRGNNGTGSRIIGTDAITLRYIGGESLPIRGSMNSRNANVGIQTGELRLVTGDMVAITDCNSTDIFVATTFVWNNGVQIAIRHARDRFDRRRDGAGTGPWRPTQNINGNLSKAYRRGAEIRKFVIARYYVGHSNTYNGRSLFRQNSNGLFDELIQGVEDLQILYGVDTDNNRLPDSYVTADNVGGFQQWNNVVSVKLAILVRTIDIDPYSPLDAGSYTLLGTTVTPPALQVRRQVFNATVQIRNRRNSLSGE